jgi:four helix bundle protein
VQDLQPCLKNRPFSERTFTACRVLRRRRMAESFDDLRDRTKRFAFEVIDLVKVMPRNLAADAIARQLIRAGTSVCANHRAAGRARSRREFIAKLGVVVEEADEAELWLEALLRCNLSPREATDRLLREARELRAIFVQSVNTAKRRLVRDAVVVTLGALILLAGLIP